MEDLHKLHKHGSQLFEEGKYMEAEPVLKEIISIEPTYADVHNKLGIISHLKGDFQQACEYFENALKLNPKYTEASLNLAISYNDMGEFKKSEEVISQAAKFAHPIPSVMDPYVAGKLANEHYKIGNVYFEQGMNDEAIEEYKKALKLCPHFPDVNTKLGMALRNKGLIDDSIAYFEKAKEVNPNYGPAWVQLGLSYYMKGLKESAQEIWEKALKQNPDLIKEIEVYLGLFKKEEK